MVIEASQTNNDADKPATSKPEIEEKPAIVVTPEVKDVQDAPIHVLAVDDSLIDRKIVERLLKNASYKVTAVDSGSKALEVLATVNNDVSIVVTDYCMPEMSGHELLTQIKTSTKYKEIPVVIMSSEDVPSRIEKCLEDGAEEFILKPVRLADIKRLKSYVQKTPVTTNSIEQQSSVKCNKRKFATTGFQKQGTERRPRLSGVIVA